VIVSIRDRIDIPIGIITQLCTVVLKVGIALEELPRSRAVNAWTFLLGGRPSDGQWGVVERASAAVAAIFGKSSRERDARIEWRRCARINSGDLKSIRAAVEAILSAIIAPCVPPAGYS
jgi:hypothetical protein